MRMRIVNGFMDFLWILYGFYVAEHMAPLRAAGERGMRV
jgi:hypothetical protein